MTGCIYVALGTVARTSRYQSKSSQESSLQGSWPGGQLRLAGGAGDHHLQHWVCEEPLLQAGLAPEQLGGSSEIWILQHNS